MGSVVNAMTSAVRGLGGRNVTVINEMAPSLTLKPASTLSGAEVRALLEKLSRFNGQDMFKTSPQLRAVVDFCARNVAQLGLHLYRPAVEGRERDRDSAAARLLASPSLAQTGYELVYSLVADLALFDEAFWVVVRADFTDSGWTIRPIPVQSIVDRHGSEWDGTFSVDVDVDGKVKRIPPDNLIHFKGWNPAYGSAGISPVESLRDTLAEQVAAQSYRLSVWKNGGLVSAYVSRPKEAPSWSDAALQRFYTAMEKFRLGGSKQGGMPVFEDGMRIESTSLNSKEQQYVESAQLSLATVARAFHVNPAMLGETGGVTYANMREFRKSLYGETLGPLLSKIEAAFNARLLPMVGVDDGTYAEFNVKEKMRGSFEEEAAVLSTATGAAGWMTPNEARATQNLPPIEGGDVLFQTPGRGSSGVAQAITGEDSPEEEKSTPVERKSMFVVSADANDSQRALINDVITRHAERQRAAVLSTLGGRKSEWWDTRRWDRELRDDLYRVATAVTDELGEGVVQRLGSPGAWDADSTRSFLWAVAETRAHMLNEGTREALAKALREESDPSGVFDDLQGERGRRWSSDIGLALAGFAVVEAGKHLSRKNRQKVARKTWIRTKQNSRDTHRALHGETVDIDEKFSNGADWPGDSILPTGEVVNCGCVVEIAVTDK